MRRRIALLLAVVMCFFSWPAPMAATSGEGLEAVGPATEETLGAVDSEVTGETENTDETGSTVDAGNTVDTENTSDTDNTDESANTVNADNTEDTGVAGDTDPAEDAGKSEESSGALVSQEDAGASESQELSSETLTLHPGSVIEVVSGSEEEADNDELFAEYVERLFYPESAISSGPMLKANKKTAGSRFSGMNLALYEDLAASAAEIANGQESSTEFSYTLGDLGYGSDVLGQAWSAADLGVEALFDENGYLSYDAYYAMLDRLELDVDGIIDALLADYPYEMYWFDKTKTGGYSYGMNFYTTQSAGETCLLLLENNIFTVSLAVAKAYSASGSFGTYETDMVKTSAASVAAANAQNIVADGSSYSDYEKVNFYKEQICELTSYNDEAADDEIDTDFGDPWQMIYVFDGDASTEVVCEGYAKAFKYLCDITDFNSSQVNCILVSGQMDGGTGAGGHMWDILTMDDGVNYLVDVTNCDTGTIGADDLLFLKGYTTCEENVAKTETDSSGNTFSYTTTEYVYAIHSKEITYYYDYTTETQYTNEELTISAADYNVPQPVTVAAYTCSTTDSASVGDITIEADETIWPGSTVTLTAPSPEGYQFEGWYAAVTVENGLVTEYGNILLAETRIYSFTITEDVQVVAVYEALGEAAVTIGVENGTGFSITCNEEVLEADASNTVTVPVGSSLYITATDGNDVLQWENESEKILGTGTTLNLVVTGDRKITLVYETEDSTYASVQFVSDYGQVLSYTRYEDGGTITFPAGPTKYGYTFNYWTLDGDEAEATEDDVLSKIDAGATEITLKPHYTWQESTYTVTVSYLNEEGNSLGDNSVYSEIAAGSGYTVNAEAFDGYVFSHWEDEDGTILGYAESYFFMPDADTILTARYISAGSTIEIRPVITIGSPYSVESGDAIKVACTVTRSIPETYTLLEHGILYARNVDGLTEDTFVYGTDGVGRYMANTTGSNGVVRLNVTVDTQQVTVSFRGYMILQDSEGRIRTYYSGIRESTYNALIAE